MRIKDTITHMHRMFSWPCLCAYLLVAFFIVLGLYTGLHWQWQSSLGSALHQPLQSPPESRDTIWLFALAFLTIFASTVILHHVFVSMALKRLTTTMGGERSQDSAEQASSPLSDGTRANANFLATMSHDIRTPMNGIVGMTNKLLESPLNDDQKQYMMRIQEAAHTLSKMIDNILACSALETQQLALEDIPFNLMQTIESCVDLLADKVQAKQLVFYFCMMSGVPQQVRGNAGRLRHILLNLLAHAINSTEAGTVAISVSGNLEGEDRVNLRIDIHSTAMNIDADVIPSRFAASSQTDAAPPQGCGDPGLGPVNVEQLAQLVQGRIGMQSLPDIGTTWRLDVSLRHYSDHKASATPLPLHHVQVLYVDNTELNSRLIFNQFASWGMAPTTIADAGSVISVLTMATQQHNAFPLIVIRHDPPTLDGYALCRDIRRTEATGAPKMLLLTATGKDSNPLESGAPPFDLSLTFPIRVTDLYHAIRQLLNHPIDPVSTGEQMPPQPAKQAPSGAMLNILLVEDNHVNQQVALSMLKKWGHRIDIAWNGLEALAAAQQQDYDLILMDIQMPEMDGITATQRIRQLDGKRGAVPIVAVTANAMQGDRERFLAAGMDDYIAKPINRDMFYMVVHRYAPPQQTAQTEKPEEIATSGTATPVLGDEVLSYLLNELSGETVSELIDEYMTHSSALLSQALVASEEQDAKNIEYAVHTLKGMSGALGALRMVDICQHILETCRNQGTQQIGSQMNGLSGATEEAQQALQAWRSEHESC